MGSVLASRRSDTGLFVLRLAVAGILLFHGIFKITHGVEWIKAPLAQLGLPGVLAYGVYVAEVAAPLFMIAGAFSRIAAMIVAADMLMAIVVVLRGRVTTINPQGGGWGIELEALLLFGAVAVAVMGSGRWAVRPD
jgi:putative oxidoreductase